MLGPRLHQSASSRQDQSPISTSLFENASPAVSVFRDQEDLISTHTSSYMQRKRDAKEETKSLIKEAPEEVRSDTSHRGDSYH